MDIKVAFLTVDKREHEKRYKDPLPSFGTAPEAVLQGFAKLPGIQVHVVSCCQEPLKEGKQQLADNIWYHGLHVPKIGWMRTGYQGCIRATKAALRQIKPDIVHGQGTERDCAISAVFSGFPNVVTIHGNMSELARLFRARFGTYAWFAARLEDFTLKRTAGVFCNSAYTEDLVRPRARRVWSVPNPIRAEFFDASPAARTREKCILVNVGVVCARKRQLELLQVAEELYQQGLKFEFQFVGQADPRDSYAAAFLKKIKSMEKTSYAKYLGEKSTSELIACFDEASALLHFPLEEAFGLVVAEGMARELKLFAAQVGGIVDIACGVPSAELFQPQDFKGLTDSIAKWIRSGFPRAEKAAEPMRSRYHPEMIARQHLEIYREVLQRHS